MPPHVLPSFGLMHSVTHRFNDLDTVIDSLHELFDEWSVSAETGPDFDETTFDRAKLAIHEWVANLVQHADFGAETPRVGLTARLEENTVFCCIEDNSSGFDFEGQIALREHALQAFPERGMGLLMLRACSESLTYEQVSGSVNRLCFTVAADQDPWLNIPF
ncbi:MAG: ATP-binding protein [Bacteroidota bacterium]